MISRVRDSIANDTAPPRRATDRLWPLVVSGIAATILLFGGIGGWFATAELAGAVIAQGVVVVDSNIKKVQHPTGGVVGVISVKDGDKVSEGDLLVRLDDTITRANLQLILKQLAELTHRRARLFAEQADLDEVIFDRRTFVEAVDREFVNAEVALFESRRRARQGQKAQFRERISQLREQAEGINAQLSAKITEIDLVRTEVEAQKNLWEKSLMSIARYTASRREAARLDGERGQLISAGALIKGRIAETELQVLQVDQDLKSEVAKELSEIQGKVAQLEERRIAAEDQLRRIDVRAPTSGIIHQLSVHTVGGVINAGEAIMQVVPGGDTLTIEVRIAPQDIDNVNEGQAALVRFPAFNQRTTPDLGGRVDVVSADVSKDAQSNLVYFTARIALLAGEIERTSTLRLKPGMPAEVHIKTPERTALSYLIKPLSDQFARSLKER